MNLSGASASVASWRIAIAQPTLHLIGRLLGHADFRTPAPPIDGADFLAIPYPASSVTLIRSGRLLTPQKRLIGTL
jgi:hypothetical protein